VLGELVQRLESGVGVVLLVKALAALSMSVLVLGTLAGFLDGNVLTTRKHLLPDS
jgi:hypothetical protein